LADACRVLGLHPSWKAESEQTQVSSDLLLIDHGEKEHAFKYPLVRLERKHKSFKGIFQEKIISYLGLPVDSNSLKPKSLIDDGVGLHFHQCMPDVFSVYCVSMVCYGIRREMAHVSIDKSLLLVCPC
jgi:hypothetical protein